MRLRHPLWTHLPAVAILLTILVLYAQAWPWPERAALQYSLQGIPHRWGSPWVLFLLNTLIPLFFIGVGIAIDEKWARHETRKRFNPLCMLDEFICGLHLITALQTLDNFKDANAPASFSVAALLGYSVLIAATAIVPELLRRHQPNPQQPSESANP